MDIVTNIAVCSRTFSKNEELRTEILSVFSNVKFNDEGFSLEGVKLVEFLNGCDRAIVGLEKIDANILSNVTDLKVISKYGVGLDNLDFNAMEYADVKLGWIPGVNSQSVAELTLALALNIVRSIPKAHNNLKTHNWNQVNGRLLSSMTFGVLGCGHVGKSLIKLLKPFGCKIISCDIKDQTEFYQKYEVESVDFQTLISTSDVLSLHVPLTEKTKNILDRSTLSCMKKGAFVVNTARGELVDEVALIDLLNEGHIEAAGLDVFRNEPSIDFNIIDHPKVFTTPHIAGTSQESILMMGRAAILGLTNFKDIKYWNENL